MIRPLSTLFGFFSRDLGIDLGTANTLVYVRGKGIVISEPSVVAIDTKTKRALAVGVEGKAMVGKTPESIIAVRPLKDGVIADFDTVEMMLHYFIRKVHMQRMMAPHPRVVIGIPSGVTEVEKRAAKDAALSAGAREAYTIEEPMAAAIGAGLADQRTGRQHDRRHRRRHHRGRGHLARRHRRQPLDPRGRRRDRRCDHPVRPARPQPGHRRAHGGERQDRRRLGLSARRRDPRRPARPRPADRLAEVGRGQLGRAARRDLASRSTRSSSWSRPRSRRRRRSWWRTSWSRASRSPAAGRCCTGWIGACRTS